MVVVVGPIVGCTGQLNVGGGIVKGFIVVLYWFALGAQHTLNTIFILFVEHRPPIRLCKSSFDEVAVQNKTLNIKELITYEYSHIK